jgi:hypothetical protein
MYISYVININNMIILICLSGDSFLVRNFFLQPAASHSWSGTSSRNLWRLILGQEFLPATCGGSSEATDFGFEYYAEKEAHDECLNAALAATNNRIVF